MLVASGPWVFTAWWRGPDPAVEVQEPDLLLAEGALRRAVMRRYGLAALPSPAELTSIAEAWRPHRTLACRYLWRSLDATPT